MSGVRGSHMHVEPEVIAAISAGQERLFEQIMSHYRAYAAAIVSNRVRDERDVEEIVQDIFAGLWRDIIAGKTVDRFAGYVRMSAIYKSLEFVKKRAQRYRLAAVTAVDDLADDDAGRVAEIVDCGPTPADQAALADDLRVIDAALAECSAVRRACFDSWRDGETARAAGIRMGLSTSNVGTCVHLTRDFIRRRLRRMNAEATA